MDIQLEPEQYAPNVNDSGMFVDHIPYVIGAGIRCPCCSRKDKVYTTRAQFSTHIKTKAHAKWLQSVNDNRANFFVENVRLQELVKQQQQIIAKLHELEDEHRESFDSGYMPTGAHSAPGGILETDLQNKLLTIDYLTKMLAGNQKPTVDLLDLDL